MYLLGVDLGSTSIKSVLFSYDGSIISIGRSSTEVLSVKEGNGLSLYWDTEKLWQNTVFAIKESLQAISNPQDVISVAVTGFGSDGIFLDKDKKEVCKAICYMDKKTTTQMIHMKESMDIKDIYNITGSLPWYYHSIYKHMWLKDNKPELYEKAEYWLNVPDYINYKLCGEMATDYSEASTTLLFDQNNLAWSAPIFDAMQLRKTMMPQIMPSGTVLGKVTEKAAAATGLIAGTKIVLGGLDLLCGSFAAGGSLPDSIMAVTGTFESTVLTSAQLINVSRGVQKNLVTQKSVVRDGYALWGAQYAGGIIEWYKKNFVKNNANDKASELTFYKELDSFIDGKPGSNGLFMLPHINGSMTPVDDPYSLGAFIGVTAATEKKDFGKSIIEGICYQSKAIVEAQEEIAGKTIKEIVNIGGAGYSRFWMQCKSDILGKVIKVPEVKESTALGAALLAGVGAGIYNSFIEANEKTQKDCVIYEPRKENNGFYVEQYEKVFKKLYENLKVTNHVINNLENR